MKLILDENLPRQLKLEFGSDFEVSTVREMEWQGKKNGELLGLIAFNGFDIFITLDKNLPKQQNLDKFNISIFILLSKDNRRKTLQELIEKIENRIRQGNYGKLTEIS
jgi:hypothetical protein